MNRRDVERLLLDISSKQTDRDQAQQSFIVLKHLIVSEPELMKSYFDKIASYIYRKNVYVRMRAIELLLELSHQIPNEQFSTIVPVILHQLESDSTVVLNSLASYIPKVIINKPHLEEVILKRILEVDRIKQKTRNWNISKAIIIEAMDQFMDYSMNEDTIIKFIKQARTSINPKTRKTAIRVLKTRNLID